MFHLHIDHTCTRGCVVAGLLHSELPLKLSQNRVQCNLDYPNLVYPEPRLSRLVGHQTMYYHIVSLATRFNLKGKRVW